MLSYVPVHCTKWLEIGLAAPQNIFCGIGRAQARLFYIRAFALQTLITALMLSLASSLTSMQHYAFCWERMDGLLMGEFLFCARGWKVSWATMRCIHTYPKWRISQNDWVRGSWGHTFASMKTSGEKYHFLTWNSESPYRGTTHEYCECQNTYNTHVEPQPSAKLWFSTPNAHMTGIPMINKNGTHCKRNVLYSWLATFSQTGRELNKTFGKHSHASERLRRDKRNRERQRHNKLPSPAKLWFGTPGCPYGQHSNERSATKWYTLQEKWVTLLHSTETSTYAAIHARVSAVLKSAENAKYKTNRTCIACETLTEHTAWSTRIWWTLQANELSPDCWL